MPFESSGEHIARELRAMIRVEYLRLRHLEWYRQRAFPINRNKCRIHLQVTGWTLSRNQSITIRIHNASSIGSDFTSWSVV
jgi:hypothetical protein